MTDTHSPSAAFLRDVHDFVIETGISESQLGRRAVGDSGAIRRLRNGQSITLRNADRIYTYMARERTRRAEAGARRSTACEALVPQEVEREVYRAATRALNRIGTGWRARLLRWFRP